jgi:hypothetical protein
VGARSLRICFDARSALGRDGAASLAFFAPGSSAPIAVYPRLTTAPGGLTMREGGEGAQSEAGGVVTGGAGGLGGGAGGGGGGGAGGGLPAAPLAIAGAASSFPPLVVPGDRVT